MIAVTVLDAQDKPLAVNDSVSWASKKLSGSKPGSPRLLKKATIRSIHFKPNPPGSLPGGELTIEACTAEGLLDSLKTRLFVDKRAKKLVFRFIDIIKL